MDLNSSIPISFSLESKTSVNPSVITASKSPGKRARFEISKRWFLKSPIGTFESECSMMVLLCAR